MSRLYWLGYGALGIAIFIAFSIWGVWDLRQYQSEQARQRQEAARYDSEAAEQKAYDPCIRWTDIVDGINCILREAHGQREDKRAEYDLQAQQDMAAWANGMLVVSTLGLLVTAVGVIFVLRVFSSPDSR